MNSDHELFRSIYVQYRPLLRTAARRKGIPYDELDDIVQETFVSYYSRYPLDWSECQIRGMLMKILKCRCIDYLRKQSRIALTYLDPVHIEDGDMDTEKIEEKDTLDVVLEEQKHQKIVDVLSGMKPDWLEVFIKLTIEGRSVVEVSRELGITESTCRARLSRAHRYLRKQLSGYQPKVMKRDEKNKEPKVPEELPPESSSSEAVPSGELLHGTAPPMITSPETVSPEMSEWKKEVRQETQGTRSIGTPREGLN